MPWGGHPQGAPLPFVFSQALCPGEGTHKGRPYHLSSLGVMPWGGHPQGAPLPFVFSRRYALGRAPTRGAPTDCLLSALCPGEGAHKGRPYHLSSLRRYALGEGVMPTHKGRPYHLSSLGVMPWGGHPQGAPLPIVFSGRYALGRAPTRGAPTICLLWALCPGEGTHKGRLSSLGVMPWGGHPQGAPLPFVFSRRYALGRAPTRGAPTICLLWALCPGEGTHKGRPYRLSSLGVMPWGGHPQGAGVMPWGGHPQGAPLPLSSLGVMPWGGHPQGAPLPLSSLQALCPGEGTHKGRPYHLSSPGVMPWGGHPQGAPLPDSGSLTWVCPNLMQLPCRLPARKIATRPFSTNVSTRGVVVRNRRSQ